MTAPGTTVAWLGPLPPPVHGASLVTGRFLEQVRSRGVEVRVVSLAGCGFGPRHHLSRVRAHVRAARTILGLPRAAVVYLSLSGGLGLLYQVPLVLLARTLGSRIVVHHHSYAYVNTHSWPMALLVAALRRGDRQLFLSESMRDGFLARYGSSTDACVISNAHFLNPPRFRVLRRSEQLRLVHVSNLSVAKGSAAAVATCMTLRARGHDAQLTLIGPCDDPEVLSAMAEAGTAVRWLGAQPTERVYAELDAADVFLFPSSYVNEAEPLAVLEALSRDVPVIATRRGALTGLLPEEWLVDAPAPELLADRVEALPPGSGPAAGLFARLRGGPDPVDLVLHEHATVVDGS